MSKLTCVIMAAGIGSRFKVGLKQFAPVDDEDRLLLEYSVKDALECGCDKIIIILREEIVEAFDNAAGGRLRSLCAGYGADLKYCIQDRNHMPQGRTKPLGTGYAVMCAAAEIDSPFYVINADDFYGRDAHKIASDYLRENTGSDALLVTYVLNNTLSGNGAVTRGVCVSDENGYLTGLTENHKITNVNGRIEGEYGILRGDELVSMNMWGFDVSYLELLNNAFNDFLDIDLKVNPLTSEFIIPVANDTLIKQGKLKVKTLSTDSVWFGMTYAEDMPLVRSEITRYNNLGLYY